jgi:serine/threonine protein kinase
VTPQLLGQQTVGRFEIREILGRGAVGDVLLAWDPREQRLVALKVILVAKTDPEMLVAEKNGLALQRQLAAVAPQVAAVYEEGQDGDYFWVAMEYVAGSDLSEVLARGPLPEARAVRIALELVSMLEVCHEFSAEVAGQPTFGVVHGDIKPENIRLQPVAQESGSPETAERVRVLDFGIAKHLSRTRRFTVNLFGSLPYTPPERLERGKVDRHSDLWAVGVVLAAMVSGRRPFPGDTPEELELAIRHGVPPQPLPAGCSPELSRIVARSLAFDVRARYQSAAELGADLAALRDGRPLPSQPGESAPDLHATRRTARPLSGEEMRAAEATRRTDRPLLGPAASPPQATQAWAAPSTGEPSAAPKTAETSAVPQAAQAWAAPNTAAATRTGLADLTLASGPSSTSPAAGLATSALGPPPGLAAARPPRGRNRARRTLALLGFLALLALAGAQLWAWEQARQIRRDLADAHPDLDAVAQRFSQAAPWSFLSPGLFGVGDDLLASLSASAGRILDSFHGDDPTTTERGWQAAYGYLQDAARIAPLDRKVKARLLYVRGHLDRIQSMKLRGQGNRKQALAASREAVAEFEEAARRDSAWPDPYLGLARIYAYDLFDVDALQKALAELERRGYHMGRREKAMLADGLRMRGLAYEARAQRLRGGDGELKLLKQARDDFDQAVRLYGEIDGYANAESHLAQVESHLESVESRVSAIHEPNFLERVGRALAREFGKPLGHSSQPSRPSHPSQPSQPSQPQPPPKGGSPNPPPSPPDGE